MLACVTTAGGAEQITACAVRMALASNAEILAGKKGQSMSAADTAREGRVYDRHGLHHHPRRRRILTARRSEIALSFREVE